MRVIFQSKQDAQRKGNLCHGVRTHQLCPEMDTNGLSENWIGLQGVRGWQSYDRVDGLMKGARHSPSLWLQCLLGNE